MHALQNIARAGALIVFVLFTPSAVHAATNDGLESKVRSFFADVPIMVDIARCESRFRQFTESGEPLYGGYKGKMVGLFQVYADIHRAAAGALGIDIETPEGNMSYARHLYEERGTDPWLSSSKCWGTPVAEASETVAAAANNSLSSNRLTKDLKLGTIDPEVLILQQILNQNGFAIAAEGLGSSGYETEKFGALTREAVRRFQCDKEIVCKGDEKTTGYGMVGARTRVALNALPFDSATSVLTHDTTIGALDADATSTPRAAGSLADIHAQIAQLLKTVTAMHEQQ